MDNNSLLKLVYEIQLLIEEDKLREGWGDVAGSVLGSAAGAVAKSSASQALNKQVQSTQMKIKAVKSELSKCGDSKWCKVKKHARLVALTNHLEELRRKRGYK